MNAGTVAATPFQVALATRLGLERPLAFVDVESTGVNPEQDRIVELAALKLWPDGHLTQFHSLVNPGIPIPPDVTAIHGITDQDVAEAPKFADLVPILEPGLAGVDFAGFNVGFDLRMLDAELARAGAAPLGEYQVVDAFRIFQAREKRDLAAAVKFYLQRNTDSDKRHQAPEDVKDTLLVLDAQLARYPDLPNTVAALAAACRPADWVDGDGKIRWVGGKPCLSFGKNAGKALQELPERYILWMLDKDFSPEVKRILERALDGVYPTPPQSGD